MQLYNILKSSTRALECTQSTERERSEKALEKLKMPKWAMNPNWSQHVEDNQPNGVNWTHTQRSRQGGGLGGII